MIELRLFGPPSVHRTIGERDEQVHLQSKSLALLGYLALAGSSRRRRDSTVALFWPELDDSHARNALSQSLHRIRRALASRDIVVSHGTEEISVDSSRLWTDAQVFDVEVAAGRLDSALNLYRGPFLDGFHIDGVSTGFEHWLESQREGYRRRAADAAEKLADTTHAAGLEREAVSWLRRLVEISPENEPAFRRLMVLLNRVSGRAEALRLYDRYAARLARELDLSPSAELAAIREKLAGSGDLSAASRNDPSVAVLPFSNLSPDPGREFFCDGMTEELIHVLAAIPGISVVARTTVFALKNQSFDVRDVAARLNVDAVLEGSVRWEGDRVRITAQLIDASNGYHLWSDRYDRSVSDALAIQDEIAESIAKTLQETLVGAVSSSANQRRENVSTDVHTLYLKGVFHRRKRTPGDLRKAAGYFTEATKNDPEYAEGYGALAYTYTLGGWHTYDAYPPTYAYPLAREAAEKALVLNDRLVEAHVALGYTAWAFQWDHVAGEAALRRAVEIDPDNYNALGQYSSYLVLHGRVDEAFDLIDRVEQLEPFWIAPKIYRGVWTMITGDNDRAIDLLLQAQTLDESIPITPMYLGDAYGFSGKLDEAQFAYERALKLMGREPIILGKIGTLFARQAQPEQARAVVLELEKLGDVRHVLPSIPAMIHAQLGDMDAAAGLFRRAADERDTTLLVLNALPAYEQLRAHAELAPVFERLNPTRTGDS